MAEKKRGRPRSNNYTLNSSFPSTIPNDDEDNIQNPLVAARLAKIKKETEKIELDIDIAKRKYIPVSEVSTAVATEYTRVRAKILSLESKLPHLLAPITDPIDVKAIIQQEVREILEELSYDNETKE